jgi:TetR/AcrR family transcriptional repressor of nem operon
MKVSRAQAEENRRTVIAAASRLFRERGFDNVGLADLMGAAGLTHGGFYKQFASKDDLVNQACERALADSRDTWTRVLDEGQGEGRGKRGALEALVRRYLSPNHRDRIGDGCAFPTLGPDVVRRDDALRRTFDSGVKAQLAMLEGAMPDGAPEERRQAAMAAFATMVGGLLLSRLVEDDTLSRQLLDAAAAGVLGDTTKGRP